MRDVVGVEFVGNSKEERIVDMEADFPCATSRVRLDQYQQPFAPWHWHKALELFYIESGALDYYTPQGAVSLYAGCGGLVNSNILHMTTHVRGGAPNIQLLYLFEPSFLAGIPGSRIERKYIDPILSSQQLELLPLFPDTPEKTALLRELRRSFDITPDMPGYELRLRSALSGIWVQLLPFCAPYLSRDNDREQTSGRVKAMMAYIYEHYPEPISIQTLADAAFCSQRECYRAFHTCLHMTPTDYLQNYRLQMACQQLTDSGDSITAIAHNCGFGSSSYFGKVFRKTYGQTPMEYRGTWRDRRNSGQD